MARWKWIPIGTVGGLLAIFAALVGITEWIDRSERIRAAAESESAESLAQEILHFEKPAGFRGERNSLGEVKRATLVALTDDMYPAYITVMAMPASTPIEEIQHQRTNSNQHRDPLPKENFKVRGRDVTAEVELVISDSNRRWLEYFLILDGSGDSIVLTAIGLPEKKATHEWVQGFLDTVKRRDGR